MISWLVMRQPRHGVIATLLALSVAFFGSRAFAEDSVERFSRLLANSEDFRVRTQAALALGASKQRAAVAPLCKGLADASTAVRVAAATALRRLNLGGADCVKQRLALEENQLAKSAMSRALENLEAGSGAEPTIAETTRYYVALGVAKDGTGRGGDAVDKLVASGMRQGGGGLCAFAPRLESPKAAAALLAKHSRLKGFYLAPKVTASYADGALTVKVDVAMSNYPGKALLGSFSVRATQPGVRAQDAKAEDELIRMLAEGAIQKFAKAAAQL